MANLIVAGDAAIGDVATGKKFCAGLLYNAIGNNVGGGGEYTEVETFLASGNFVVPAGITEVNVLIIAGGGGGGGAYPTEATGGAGGGAGGVLAGIMTVTPEETLAVVVGAGGAGGAKENNGVVGENSTFNGATALGGGIGRLADTDVNAAGGSGGGGSGSNGEGVGGIATQNNSVGLYGLGHCGGIKNDPAGGEFTGGGGGGAGGLASGRTPGEGFTSSISESSVTYAVGGYGQGSNEANDINPGVSGAANTGNGGNGASRTVITTGGNGGSGIVIIKY